MLIDVHAHQFPKAFHDVMLRHGRGSPQPLIDQQLEQRLQFMDEASVDVQVLSPADTVPYFEREADAVEAARLVNDGYADLTHRLPRRFKAFVSLPLPHIEASLREMERGLDELGFAGVAFGCSILNRPVTEKQFEPIYEEMNRRRSILFFHPVVNGICSALLNDFRLAGSVGTTIEDTTVALHMIVSQLPHRYPNIRIIVPHFGGLLPMLMRRIDNQVARTYPNLPEKPSETARRFWYDTVGHGSHAALRCAVEAFGADRLVTGSDYPVLIPFETYDRTFAYIREAGLPEAVAEQILHRNTPVLFGLSD